MGLEFEAFHHAVRDLPNVIVGGDFNAPSTINATCTTLHGRLAELLGQLGRLRDTFNQRHYIIGENGAGPRLKDDWCFTALSFAERRLGYRHAWQSIRSSEQDAKGEFGLGLPLYSHWSGQLIDHCLLRDAGSISTPGGHITVQCNFAGIFHTDASDHLPLIL